MQSIILQGAGRPKNGSNEVQLLTIGGTPTGGTFTISYGSLVSGAITWSATNATLVANIQAALDTMLGTNSTLVAASSLTAGIGTITITFQNIRGSQAQSFLMVATSSLTPPANNPTAAITLQTAGITATGRGNGIGSEYVDNTTGVVYINVSQTALNPKWIPRGIICYKVGSPALGTSTAVHAAVSDTGAQQVITTAITNPDVARAITATPGGTTANVTAVSCIITGTDINGNPLTETLPAFTAGSSAAVTSVNAFKTITSITQPACGTSVTISYGLSAKLGIPDALNKNTILKGGAFLNGVKEGTEPTVTTNAVASQNLVQLNSALNGTAVEIHYYVPF